MLGGRVMKRLCLFFIWLHNVTSLKIFNDVAWEINESRNLGLMGNSFSSEEARLFGELLEACEGGLIMPKVVPYEKET